MPVSTQRLEEFWTETLTRDLTGFADPRTDVLVGAEGSNITAMWTQRGRECNELFRLTPDGDFRWIPVIGNKPCTYRQFLCSEGLADFVQLAQAITHGFPEIRNYVETRASINRNGNTTVASSHQNLLNTSAEALGDPIGKTQMFFLKGDAGAGKTTLLREVTRHQAQRYRQKAGSHCPDHRWLR